MLRITEKNTKGARSFLIPLDSSPKLERPFSRPPLVEYDEVVCAASARGLALIFYPLRSLSIPDRPAFPSLPRGVRKNQSKMNSQGLEIHILNITLMTLVPEVLRHKLQNRVSVRGAGLLPTPSPSDASVPGTSGRPLPS